MSLTGVLDIIENDLDNIFQRFYNQLLSNEDFSVFFRDQKQIDTLIEKQKRYFMNSLTMSDEQLRDVYIPLGERHYDLKLPYVDFAAGMTIMEEGIIRAIASHEKSGEIIDAAFHFFKIVRGFTAKGYLNRMLEADSHDIDLYLENVRRSSEIDTLFATERIIWLKNLIFAIKIENRAAAPSLQFPQQILDSIKSISHDDPALVSYIEDVLSRLEIDAANVFFFLENRSYEEVITLYRELMSIYKLSLMITNVMTIAASSSMICALNKDALTGLLTRSSLNAVIKREISIALASNYPLALILMDIDHFKTINDNYGHAAGDMVLKTIAGLIQETIRATDFAFRIGGEEFLLLLKGANNKVSSSQAESIRSKIEQHEFHYDGKTIRVTASFGVSTFQRPFTLSFSSMLKDADTKLYTSKGQGRNRVTD